MRPCTDIEDEGLLEPWDKEMGTFANGVVDDTAKSIEKDGALATVDGVEGGVEDGGTNSETESGACHVGEEGDGGLAVRHCCDLS